MYVYIYIYITIHMYMSIGALARASAPQGYTDMYMYIRIYTCVRVDAATSLDLSAKKVLPRTAR